MAFLLALGLIFFNVEEARANPVVGVASGAAQTQGGEPNAQSGVSSAGTSPGNPRGGSQEPTLDNQTLPTEGADTTPSAPLVQSAPQPSGSVSGAAPTGAVASPLVGEAAEPAGQAVGGVAAPAGQTLEGVAESAGQAAAPVAEGVGGAVGTAAEPIEVVSDPTLGTAGAAVGGAVEPVAQTVAPTLAPVAEEAAIPVLEPVNELADVAIGPVSEGASPLVDPVGEVVNRAAEPVAEPIGDMASPFVAPVVEAANPVTKPVIEVAESVVEPPRPLAALVAEAANPVMEPAVESAQPLLAEPVASPDAQNFQPDTSSGPSGQPAMDLTVAAPASEPAGTEPSSPDGEPGGHAAERSAVSASAGAPRIQADESQSRIGEFEAVSAEPMKTVMEDVEAPVSKPAGEPFASAASPVSVLYGAANGASSSFGVGKSVNGAAVSPGSLFEGYSLPLPAAPPGSVSSASAAGFAVAWGILVSILSVWLGGKLLWNNRQRFQPESMLGLALERPG